MLNFCVERPMSLHCNSDMCMFTGVSSKFSVIRVFSLSFVQFNALLGPHSSSQHGASHCIKTAKVASYPDLGGLAPESVHCFGGACDLVLALCWSMFWEGSIITAVSHQNRWTPSFSLPLHLASVLSD